MTEFQFSDQIQEQENENKIEIQIENDANSKKHERKCSQNEKKIAQKAS